MELYVIMSEYETHLIPAYGLSDALEAAGYSLDSNGTIIGSEYVQVYKADLTEISSFEKIST